MTDYVAVRPAYIGYKADGSKHVLDDDTGDAVAPSLVADANGSVGVAPISRSWADLPTPSAANAGMQVFCPEYPTPSNLGALLVSTGTRWKAPANDHAIMGQAWASGLTIAAASADTVIADLVRAIPAGMIIPGDSLILRITYDNVADAAGGASTMRVRSHTTSAVTSGSEALRYVKNSTTFTTGDVEKPVRVLSNTAGKATGITQAGTIVTTGSLVDTTFSDLSALSYLGLCSQNASDTETFNIYYIQLALRYGS